MCVVDFAWYWDGPGEHTPWAEGLGTCCNPDRTPGDPGRLLTEYTEPDPDGLLPCLFCTNMVDGCKACSDTGSLAREPKKEWVCQFCLEANKWLDHICGGEYSIGPDSASEQIQEHCDEGFGGPWGHVLVEASSRGWDGYSLGMIKDVVAEAIKAGWE